MVVGMEDILMGDTAAMVDTGAMEGMADIPTEVMVSKTLSCSENTQILTIFT